MARRRFFVPEVCRGTAELTGPDAEHLVRVLRAEPGQVYEISDNRDLYLAEIETARKSAVSFRVLERIEPPPPDAQVALVAALIKFDRFEWLIEKATELGVTRLQPFEAARTERGLFAAASNRLARWEKIGIAASQQSRRAHLPVIDPPVRFVKALESDGAVRLLLDENPDVPSILEFLHSGRGAGDSTALLVGPEGGWTDEERAEALARGWMACSLGRNILRAETAAMAALAIVQASRIR